MIVVKWDLRWIHRLLLTIVVLQVVDIILEIVL